LHTYVQQLCTSCGRFMSLFEFQLETTCLLRCALLVRFWVTRPTTVYGNHETLTTLLLYILAYTSRFSIATSNRRICPFTSPESIDKPGEIYLRGRVTHTLYCTHARLSLLRFIGFRLGRINASTERILERSMK
jgi:hypothetical protein